MKKHRANERKAMLRRGAASRKARLTKTVREWYNGEYQRKARKHNRVVKLPLSMRRNAFASSDALAVLDYSGRYIFTIR